jgi:hypothetical protein
MPFQHRVGCTESSSDINTDGAQCPHPLLRIYNIQYMSGNFHYSVILSVLILLDLTT